MLVEALKSGDQILLLRKGGITDVGGEFKLEADRFWLWPTYLHQDTDWLAEPEHHRLADVMAEPRAADTYRLDSIAEVDAILEVPSRAALDAIADHHVWSPDYLDLRWRYRPELPLYLLILRASTSSETHTITETAAQRGCKSWVEVGALPTGELTPALTDDEFASRREDLVARLRA